MNAKQTLRIPVAGSAYILAALVREGVGFTAEQDDLGNDSFIVITFTGAF